MSTKETKDAVAFLDGFAIAIKNSLSDKKLDFSDSKFAIPLVSLAREAVKDCQKIPGELKNMNGEEMDELIRLFVAAITDMGEAVALVIESTNSGKEA